MKNPLKSTKNCLLKKNAACRKWELDLRYLQTDLMIADVLTKGLGKTKPTRFCAALLGDTQP